MGAEPSRQGRPEARAIEAARAARPRRPEQREALRRLEASEAAPGLLVYHEQQSRRGYCGLHAVNGLLQRRAVTRTEMCAIAEQLDRAERQLMKHWRWKSCLHRVTCGHCGFRVEESQNGSEDGNFSFQVLQNTLRPFEVELQLAGQESVEEPWGFLIYRNGHWLVARKIGEPGVWVDLDSALLGPRLLSAEEVFYMKAGMLAQGDGIVFRVVGAPTPTPRQPGSNITKIWVPF